MRKRVSYKEKAERRAAVVATKFAIEEHKMTKSKIFEATGPLLGNPSFGPEPSLEFMVYEFYMARVGNAQEAVRLRDNYIKGWLETNGDSDG